jgi:hypothetical protein
MFVKAVLAHGFAGDLQRVQRGGVDVADRRVPEDGLDGGQRHALRVQVGCRRPSQQVGVDACDADAASDVLDGMVDVRLRERLADQVLRRSGAGEYGCCRRASMRLCLRLLSRRPRTKPTA